MNDNNVNKLITESILKLGSIVSSDYHNEDPFWEDTDYLEHRKNCNLVLNGSGAPNIVEKDFISFIDSWGDVVEDSGIHVISNNDCSICCACGKYQNVEVRYDRDYITILRDVLE